MHAILRLLQIRHQQSQVYPENGATIDMIQQPDTTEMKLVVLEGSRQGSGKLCLIQTQADSEAVEVGFRYVDFRGSRSVAVLSRDWLARKQLWGLLQS